MTPKVSFSENKLEKIETLNPEFKKELKIIEVDLSLFKNVKELSSDQKDNTNHRNNLEQKKDNQNISNSQNKR